MTNARTVVRRTARTWIAGVACTSASALTSAATAQTIYPTTPNWQSSDMQVSTGAALADLNRDGWLDLVIANGNDIERQRVVVYYNGPSGLQSAPGWQSADIGYHGHLSIADVDGDGWLDVAVSRLMHEAGPVVKLYRNNQGTLSSLPVWTSPALPGSWGSFGVAFGDMNADGRPDLAVAVGTPYGSVTPRVSEVYLNIGGTLSSTPSWQTADLRNYGGCHWLDADDDGWLDLCFAGWGSPTYIYRNLGGVLSGVPSYTTTDHISQFCLMITSGDVTGDGRPDLLIADNNQVFGGSGRFRMYPGVAPAFFAPAASWTYASGYASAVALGDVDGDGDLDLCTGTWFAMPRLFLNNGSGFGAAPAWTAAAPTVTVEKLVLGDLRGRGRRQAERTFAAAAGRRLYYFHAGPIDWIDAVMVDGAALGPHQFTYDREHGWVSVGVVPQSEVRVVYSWSPALDLAVVNWDSSRPNQVYLNQLPHLCYANCDLSTAVPALNVADFGCFLQRFAGGDLYANCDRSTQPPVLNVADFGCFLQKFAAGCP